MRLFGLVSRDGFDPFSITEALDCFWKDQVVQPCEPLVIYKSDPAFKIVKAWGEMRSIHVVDLPECQDMIADYVGYLLVPASLDRLPPDPRDLFMSSCAERATARRIPIVTLVCESCPT